MNDIFREWFDNFVVVYIDDILIYSGSLDEHEEEHLRKVFQRLRENKLYTSTSGTSISHYFYLYNYSYFGALCIKCWVLAFRTEI